MADRHPTQNRRQSDDPPHSQHSHHRLDSVKEDRESASSLEDPPHANDVVMVPSTHVVTDRPEDVQAASEERMAAIMYGNDPAVGATSQDFSVGSAPSEYDPEHTPACVKQTAAKEERNRLGKRETRAILCLRILVILLLLVLAATTSATIYFWVQSTEDAAFESNFGFYSKLVQESFNNAIERKLSAVDSLSVIYTSHSLEAGETFPFVTVPNFEYKGSNARITGDTVMAFYLPYITKDTRVEWEEYTRQNGMHLLRSWREEQRQKRAQDEKYGLETPELEGFGQEALESGALSDGERRPPGYIWFVDGDIAELERDENVSLARLLYTVKRQRSF
jgi:hypothetical protein